MPEEYMSMLKSLPSEVDKVKDPVVSVATVDVGVQTGPPRHLASGILYGIPDKPDQIPDHFYKAIGFNYGRGGGSQLPGTKGYAVSLADYEVKYPRAFFARFASALSNYRTTRKHGGEFIYLLPAAWGADGGQSEGFAYPGDDNNWTSWDEFLERTLDDVKKSDMIEGLVVDIWNEPDLSFFWNRSMEQWLELWTRSFKKIREVLPSVRITGPSISAIPSASHEWWSAFLSRCKDSLPDQWSWHMEGGEEAITMASSMASFHDMLSKHGIPLEKAQDVNINEYAVYGEQVPSAGAWWIAGLERENAHGLRGNWAIAGALHDFMAGLLSKPNGSDGSYAIEGEGYWPTAEYQVYKYYASSMKGQRLKTTASSDGLLDVYATVEKDVVRILAGTRSRPGNWSIDVVGLTDDTRVKVKTLAFRVVDGDRFKRVDGPLDLEEREERVKGGKLSLKMKHQDPTTAFAFELTIVERR
ncbi:hypothetical protein CEK26_009398 [Fusarium fujikuroi]|uniref:Glycosyl hydrolases family 39 N-terminal catalytic domain-containing protein n=1 Tax=Fusarium fujikuroi TaxID=5127 RepID=A0A5Q3DH84_FUSFU|nr:hypothetical protein CEK27_009419 [Fusarium fujikuroi]QGI82700.1 hypothetical protein CEK25_009429 [Fusarium fujikuroi]QGI96329.1 hypothetical protein CEK26_009398 [Fusarium fujikuroi]VTT74406.1 unnamed protein product [Fusarium fujikuroi]VTT83247.1 unnamed protein product [Fusarium fujikuroi]